MLSDTKLGHIMEKSQNTRKADVKLPLLVLTLDNESLMYLIISLSFLSVLFIILKLFVFKEQLVIFVIWCTFCLLAQHP